MLILPEIPTLSQYLESIFKDPNLFDSIRCEHCHYAALWRHGGYWRKPDRSNPADQSLNPVFIQRFFCPACKKTCSVLPECMPPRRWYLWDIQQAALELYLVGCSLRAIAAQLVPDRRTIGRWVKLFQERFLLQEDALRNRDPELGRASGFVAFWQACLDKFSLATAMRFCHASGVSIP
jgi:transposase-like protein